ncbi:MULTISPECIES: response regulator transcription factor [Brucella/Ochrobactrum group]|uniref:Flagellar transcriptional regulator FtcR n=2 Tax=Ochrobactrum TaxID=528 RepID=A0ABD5JVG9_9HYPH|nr:MULTISPECIES: response regulator [Brucella]MCI1001688.1 response regulator transcription factor [Ochrobactrum sp. C6C9]RRD27064.1 DNA-binding response regulator [Brucellaceae bacterium VT-16-1752]MDX4076415.1 response regulator [Brucella sp. NBRC 113783]RLL64886.1 DNA-binding response regulator [[Ochrobactrum] soli]WHS33300.1 response regulator [Brucella sp. NM4]
MSEAVYVIDDDEAFRDSLVWLLESSQYTVRAFDSAEAFLDAASPDMSGCVIADVRMSGITGLELHRRLRTLGVDLPTIIVTGHGDVPMAVTAFRDGVVDFIEKPLDDKYVLERIEFCLAKARENARLRQQADDFARRYESLTQREKEVLEYIVAGKLNKQIADLMDISIKTVEVHRSRVMEKMQVTNVAELVRQKLSFSEGAKKKPA